MPKDRYSSRVTYFLKIFIYSSFNGLDNRTSHSPHYLALIAIEFPNSRTEFVVASGNLAMFCKPSWLQLLAVLPKFDELFNQRYHSS